MTRTTRGPGVVRRPAALPAALARSALLALALATCGHDFEPPDRRLRVDAAQARFTAELFDTVVWTDDALRAREGNEVYAAACNRCHGPLGGGGTEYARSRGFDVPPIVEPEWPLAKRPDSVRRHVFIGHARGMPSFGLRDLSPREVDAVTYYVLEVLRPDVLSPGR